jgi:prepilin-type N-terminal cleavage/methylation domain-containing protein
MESGDSINNTMSKLGTEKSGFSLIEVLVVLAILGLLAGLAIPVFTAQTIKASGAEAVAALDALRSSAIRYFSLSVVRIQPMFRLV